MAANLLVNGDFTQTDPTQPLKVTPPGWTWIKNPSEEFGLFEEGVQPNSFRGTPPYKRLGQPDTVNYYNFGGDGRGYSTVGTGISQTFSTVANRSYRLTFAMNAEFACAAPDGTVNTTKVTAGDLDVNVPVPYMPSVSCLVGSEPGAYKNVWLVKTYTFKASSASTTLSFVNVIADGWGNNDTLLTGIEVTEISPVLTVNKLLGGTGRINPADQFTVQIKDAGSTVVNDPANSTTEGNGTTVTSGKGTTGATTLAAGASYTLAEVMAAGSISPLSYYNATLSCSNTNTAGTNVSALTMSSSIVLAAGDVVTCNITNTPAPPGGISGRVFADVGRSAGVANDGVLNGGEQALSGVALQLTNCAGTVYGQTLTDGQGAYSFRTPNVATGAALCVVQTNTAGYTSTGASVGNTALPSGSPVSVSGTSYTYTRSSDQIAFSWNGTGHSDLNFGDVPASSLAANGTKTAAPGSLTTYAHTFTAGTAGTVVFSISSSTATPALNGWSERVFLDPDCTGSLPSGATQIYPPVGAGISVSAQQKVCVIVQEYVPATAQIGYKNEATLQAALALSNANPALSASYSVTDTTQVDNVSLNLFKEVRNVTQNGTFGANNQAKSGDVLEYRITYTNMTPAVLSNLTINDTTPAFTSFVSASQGSTPPTLTACVKTTPASASAVSCGSTQSAGGTGSVIWRFTGSLPGSGTGQVLFQVKVD